MEVLLLIGGTVLLMAGSRAWLAYLNAVAVSRLGQGRIVVELRSQVDETSASVSGFSMTMPRFPLSTG